MKTKLCAKDKKFEEERIAFIGRKSWYNILDII